MARGTVSSRWSPRNKSSPGPKGDMARPRARGRSAAAQIQPLQRAEAEPELVRGHKQHTSIDLPLTSTQLSRGYRPSLHTQLVRFQFSQRLDVFHQESATATTGTHQTCTPHNPLPHSSVRARSIQLLIYGRRLEDRLRPVAEVHWPQDAFDQYSFRGIRL